ncbi:MAG: glycosyltransferase [Phycisphaera sp.]|nr:glycosyltransferase [Phycisphaera sp.]
MKPDISIVIPCHNAERLVGDAIASALAQTHANVEVIVIDDGSTDGSLGVIESFGDRVRQETGPNRGACAARNRGVELARGAFVQFLDADDVLHPTKIATQLAVAEAAGPETLVYCDGDCDDGSTAYQRPDDPAEAVRFVLAGVLPTLAPLHRRAWLERIGGWDESLPCSQERDLHLRLACDGIRFVRLAESLFTVRRTPGSISADPTRVLEQHLQIAMSARRMLLERNALTEDRARALAGFLARDARSLLRAGRAERAAEYFAKAADLHPDGGVPEAYRPLTRLMRQTLGPVLTERLVMMKRSAWRTT